MGSYLGYQHPQRKDSVMGLHVQITKFQGKGGLGEPDGELKQCSFHNQKMKQQYDDRVRNCLRGKCHDARFTKATQLLLSKYLQYYDHKLATRDDEWEILQYEDGGLFSQHRDRRINNQNELYIHVAMEILIPPKCLCKHSGGQLKIFQDHDSWSNPLVSADQKLWTHIILPLGVYHQIWRVSGKRISYNKQVFVEKKENEYYQIPNRSCAKQLYN